MILAAGVAFAAVMAGQTQPTQPSVTPSANEASQRLGREFRAEEKARLKTLVDETAATERGLQPPVPPQQELATILDDFHAAASKADYEKYFAHWSPVSVFLGTDATERWVGQEFRDYAKKRFDTGKGWTYRSHDRHITMAPDGEHAFFDELLDNEKYGTCRGSGVFRKMEGKWWLMQYNLSVMVPNELAEGVTAIIKRGAPPAPKVDEKHKE
jgi:hypothetical protein